MAQPAATAVPLPTFSEAERSRRWRETRERMAAAGIGGLAMPPSGGYTHRHLANQRYLSQVGGNQCPVGMVFPLDGEPTLIVPTRAEIAQWQRISWVQDLRDSGGARPGRVMAQRLRELKLSSATIGVPFLSGDGESPLPIGVLDALRAELPGARLVDATALMETLRATKSDEEIAMLERAVRAAEWGIFSLGYSVHSGLDQPEALGILEGGILKAGGELGSRILWECSASPTGAWWHAYHEPMRRGEVLQNEIQARVAGYGGLEVHPICVGKPPQAVYEMFELSARIFDEALPLLKPGASVSDVAQLAQRAAGGTPYHASIEVQSCGLALEAIGEAYRGRQAVALRPVIRADDGLTIGFSSTVVVTTDGGRRLGKRPIELMLTSRSFMTPYLDSKRVGPSAPWLV